MKTTLRVRRRGLTLLELVVAIALLGLVAAVAVPALPTGRATVRGAAEKIAALHREAARAATAAGRPATLELTRGGGWTLVMAGPEPLASDTLARGVLELPAGTRLQFADADARRIVFDPLGRARSGRVRVEGDDGAYDVVANDWTGLTVVRAE